MPLTKLSRMLTILRRYTSAQAKDRAPDEMIEDFRAATGETAPSLPKPATSDEDRPTPH